VLIQGDYQKSRGNSQAGSIISISGQIFAQSAKIDGGDYNNDVISLTNVTKGTVTTVNTGGGTNTVNVGIVGPPVPNNGVLDNIQGPLSIVGDGHDTLNLDDSGDTTTWTGTHEPRLTATNLTGLGMGTPTGVAYSGLAALNLDLGIQPQTVNVRSTAGKTTSTITSLNNSVPTDWNVGSLAPKTSGGVLAGIVGPLVLNAAPNSLGTLNFDDSGSTLAHESGMLTDTDLSGSGLGYTTFDNMRVLNIYLGTGQTDLSATISDNLAKQTTIVGGASAVDTFNAQWDGPFDNSLTLLSLEYKSLTIGGNMDNGSVLDVASPAEIQNLDVKGSVEVGATIEAQSIDRLSVAGDLDESLTFPGLTGALATALALGSGEIGGTLPVGVTLAAASIGQLEVDGPLAGDVTVEPAAGNVNAIVNNLGELDAGAIPYTGTVTVAGDLGTLDVGRGFTEIGHDMAGYIDVTGTLGTARIGGDTPGEFVAGHVGTIGAYGGFGPVALNVIEAGVQRWLEVDPAGVVFSQASPFDTAGSPYVNIQYLYESAGFSSPQISAHITNGVGTAPDQFDLSTVVFQDGGTFNLDRLDAAGVAGIRNVAVEGNLVTTLSTTASNYFRLPDGSSAGGT